MRNTRTARPERLLATVALIMAALLAPGNSPLAQRACALQQDRPEPSGSDLAGVQEVARAFRKVARLARPGVAHIHVSGWKADPVFLRQLRQHLEEQLGDDFTEDAWQELLNRLEERSSSGSGIIFDKRGHILTNNHVVGGWEKITVRLPDERECDATLIGTDPKTDLAVVKIDASNLHPLRFGDSDEAEVGDWVLAVGAPFGFTQSVTHGIISAKGRRDIGTTQILYQDFLQTDAAINPGNSGGPLVNLRGEVVGVNTAIGTDGERYNMGVAFTIPSNMALRVARQLIAHGEVVRGWLGISLADLTDEDTELFDLRDRHGVMVDVLYEDSPAQKAGLRCEDIIVKVNDTEAHDMRALQAAVADIPPGQVARLKVLRDGKERSFDVPLDKQPADIDAWVRAARAVKSREVESLPLRVRTMREELADTLDRTPGRDVALAERARQHRGERGVLVTEFASEDTDARTSTLTPGELIISCNDRPVATVATLESAIEATERTRRIKLTVLTPEGKRRIVRLTRE